MTLHVWDVLFFSISIVRIYEHEMKIVIMKVLDLMKWFPTFFSRVPFSSRIIMTRMTFKLFHIVATSCLLENTLKRIMIRTMTSITWPVLTMLLRKRCNLQPVFYHVIEKLMYIRAKKRKSSLYIFAAPNLKIFKNSK